ncbi:hypothetical protein ANO11243_029320 [Dothideomycetidae sp. 11243]|nr:hypothetical protein ANO11243_029320 [fungal sp. No.11243]
MPICIECGFKIANLYTTYSKADDRSLGKGVRLTQCPRCKRFADKYVEHDYVVIFIDLVLIKPQVYRHLLFNRLARQGDRFDPSIIRLGVLLLLFDVYLTWARIEKAISPLSSSTIQPSHQPISSALQAGNNFTSNNTASGNSTLLDDTSSRHQNGEPFSAFLTTQPILIQYIFFLTLCFSETAAFHLPIRWLLGLFPPSQQSSTPAKHGSPRLSSKDSSTTSPSTQSAQSVASSDGIDTSRWIPYYPHPSVISTALLVSSFTKLFPLLLLIWSYDLPSSASAVSWAVIVNNVAALEILLDCGFPTAICLAAVGAVCRGLVGWGVLRAVGVEGGVAAAGVVETGDLLDLWRRVAGHLGWA